MQFPSNFTHAVRWGKYLSPALVTLVILIIVVTIVIVNNSGDPLILSRIGTRFQNGDPNGSLGYDGQFFYYIARDLRPLQTAQFLDVPAYRYQRILYPLLVKILSLGNSALIPWLLVIVGIASQTTGTWLVAKVLEVWGCNRWNALIFGLWIGLVLSVRLDLPEPLAYALVAGAVLAGERGHLRLSWLLYGLSLFAKEVTIGFVLAAGLTLLWRRRWRDLEGYFLTALLPYIIFQAWLWIVFGQPGLGSGGANATPFEIIPFMGLWRIGFYSSSLLIGMILVMGPVAIFPSLWGIWMAIKKLKAGETNPIVFALLINCIFFAALPFSTFIDAKGLLRFLCGLVFAVLLFAAKYRIRNGLKYGWLWLVLNVFLITNI